MRIICDHSPKFRDKTLGCLLCERMQLLDEIEFLKGAHKEALRLSLEPVVTIQDRSLEKFVEELEVLNEEIRSLKLENETLKKGGEDK